MLPRFRAVVKFCSTNRLFTLENAQKLYTPSFFVKKISNPISKKFHTTVAIYRNVFSARSVDFVFEQIATTVCMQIVFNCLQHIIEFNFF